jgi:hypothetical protein
MYKNYVCNFVALKVYFEVMYKLYIEICSRSYTYVKVVLTKLEELESAPTEIY